MKNIKTNIKQTLKKALPTATLLAMLFSLLPNFGGNIAKAGALTNLAGSLSNQQASATSNLTLSFVAENNVPVTGRIDVNFYSFTWNIANKSSLLSSNTDINNGIGSGSPTFDSANIAYNFGSLVLPLSGSGINAGDLITIVIPSVTNPSYEGSQNIEVRTADQYGTTIDGSSGYSYYANTTVSVGTPEIQGRVTGPDGVTPVANAYVNVRMSSSGQSYYSNYGYANTDASGNFYVFINPMSQGSSVTGTYTVEVMAPYGGAYKDALPITNVSVTDGVTNNLGAILLTQPNVIGVLKKSDGVTPMQNVGVSLHNSNWTVYKWSNSDINGNFSFGGVGAGTYTVEFSASWNEEGLVAPNNQSITVTTGVVTNMGAFSYTTAQKTISGTVLKSTGSPVTNAKVNAYRENGMGWAEASTGADGTYSMTVGGGTWNVNIYPNYSSAGYQNIDWNYYDMPTKVKFSSDNAVAETKTTNFTVKVASATVLGTVVKPDGTPLSSNGSVDARANDGQGGSSTINADGTFSFKVPAGTYDLRIYTWDGNYGSPTGTNFTVAENATYNAGTITLLEKKEHITGTVKDTAGNVIANQYINAWKMNGEGWANAQSGSDGTYDLKVFPGSWMISMYLDSGMMGGYSNTSVNYVYNDPPTKVSVAANETKANNDFIVKIADATITGTVVDASNSVLSDMYGYAYVSAGNTEKGYGMMGMGMGAPVSNGQFTLKVPAGTYSVGVSTPPGANYTFSESVSVTIASGGTETVSVKALPNNATINGYLKDTSGNIITGVMAWINAENGNMAYQSTSVDAAGKYELKVSAGDWRIGYWVNYTEEDYLNQSIGDNKITAIANDTVTKDLILQKADSTISGTVTGPNGTALPWVWISIDTRSGQKDVDDIMSHMYSLGTSTSSNGSYTLDVPAGTYYVKAFMPLEYGYINPDEVKIVVDASTPATVNLQFKSPDATITGTVTDSAGTVADEAMVWAYSDDGGYTQTTTDSNGDYTLNVTKKDEWHIGAVEETNTAYAKSNETVVDVPDGIGTSDQDLSLGVTGTMPESVVATFDASNSKTMTLEDGTVISVPAGALATSGNVTVTATPKAKVPAQDSAKPIGIGYDITATDSNGTEITSTFNSNVTVTLPYTDAQLTAGNLEEDDLAPSYWDETNSTWKTMDNVVLNAEKNTVSISTNHFTDFALVAASDTTPPSAPSGVIITDPSTGGQLNLVWTNPTDSDFSSINIYRSTTSGALGTKVYSSLTGISKSDTGLTDGTTYYYTLRAVDTLGNESANTTQSSGVPTTAGLSVQTPGSTDESVNTRPGVSGNDNNSGSSGGSSSSTQNHTYFSIHPNGTLVTSVNTGSVYLLENGKKRPIANAAIFEARGYKWENIITVTDSELNLYLTGANLNTYPDGSLLKDSDGKIYIINDGLKSYITSPVVFADLGYRWADVISVSDTHLALYSNGADVSSSATHLNGTLVKAASGTSVYLLEGGKKRGIASPSIFAAWGHKWDKVVSITQAELDTYTEGAIINTYPNGTLLKNSSNDKIYLISAGKKRLITSPVFFEDMGYKWSSVITETSAHLDLYTTGADVKISNLHPNGTLVKTEGGSSVYLIDQGKKRPIVSAAIFDANGFEWNEIITIKRSELEMYTMGSGIDTYPTGTLLNGPDGKIYVVSGSNKRYIIGQDVFNKLGYKWENIISVSDSHLALYTNGSDLANANVRPDGTLIKGSGNKNVYIIESGQKRLITSPVIFERWGYKWSNIISISGPELAQYVDGADLNTYQKTALLKDENNKVYLISNGKKHWFIGPSIFENLGYTWSNLISVNSADLTVYTDGINVQ